MIMKNMYKELEKLSVHKTLIFLLLVLLTFGSCKKEDVKDMPLINIAAPGFSLSSTEGTEVMLSDFKNKVVVLFFIGHSCPPCKLSAPSVESILVTPFASHDDYQVIGLDVWDGNLAAVETFRTVTGVSFPLLLNASGLTFDYTTSNDRLVVIDKKGDIVFNGIRGASFDIAEVSRIVEGLLATM
jgi:peroxiredoxin